MGNWLSTWACNALGVESMGKWWSTWACNALGVEGHPAGNSGPTCACDALGVEGHPAERHGRNEFPSDFMFGVGSSAYQCEGAANEGGRGKSIWDTFSNGAGDVACDQYHRYKEDVKLMVDMGIDTYRFSISWPRILPNGRGTINEQGVEYYNNLIDELRKNRIQPFATIYHWDLPQVLQDEYEGFLSPRIVEDFRNYADICFSRFGDRVKYWTTINEPYNMSVFGYDTGTNAPGHKTLRGDPCTEAYKITHNLLLSHAQAVQLYRQKYKSKQEGHIGIALDVSWFLPFNHTSDDTEAVQRILDFTFGWFMDPLTTGEYPSEMIKLVGSRLPTFSDSEARQLRGSFDFLGINYYTTHYATSSRPVKFMFKCAMDATPEPTEHRGVRTPIYSAFIKDSQVGVRYERDKVSIGEKTGVEWLRVYSSGLRLLLNYIKNRYNNPTIFITENGTNEMKTMVNQNDKWRERYHLQHICTLLEAIRHGSDIKGYFAWTFLDCFEWDGGYDIGFGFYSIAPGTLERQPKSSIKWFKNFLLG